MLSENPKTKSSPSNSSLMDNAIKRVLEEAHSAHEKAECLDAGRDSAYVEQLAEAIRQLEAARRNALDTLEP